MRPQGLSLIRSLASLPPLYFAVFLMRFSFGLVLFTLPVYLPRREFSNLIVGVIAAAYPVVETITGPIIGVLADRFGRRRWIYIGLAISSIVLFTFTLSREVRYLFILHGIQGLAASMIVVSSLTIVSDVAPPTSRGREMGVYDFANLGGYVVGIFLAGILTRNLNPVTPFYVASALAAAAAIFCYFRIEETGREVKGRILSPIETMRILFGNRRSTAMFPIWLAVTIFIGMGLTFGPRLGPSRFLASISLAGVALVLIFTQPFFGKLSDRHGRDRLMILGMLSLVGFFLTAIPILRGTLPFLPLSPLLVLFAIGSFAFPPAALASLVDFAPAGGKGTTMGAYSLVISLGTIIGPLLGGYLLDRYGFVSLIYAAVIILIGALALTALISIPDRSITLQRSSST